MPPDIHDPEATPEDHQDWDNKTAFLARLTSHANLSNDEDPLDFSIFGLWALRSAFEENPESSTTTIPAVRNAALWIIYAGDALRKLASEKRDMSGNSGVAGNKFPQKTWKGFDEERWNLWKAGFEAAANSVDEAQEASKIMQNLH